MFVNTFDVNIIHFQNLRLHYTGQPEKRVNIECDITASFIIFLSLNLVSVFEVIHDP